jgi:magnesium-transporting ATPase (P-type)
MSTLVRSSGNEGHLYTKGASEIIAEMCNSYLANDGTTQAISPQMREEIMQQITTMASSGLRTIGIAYCPVSNLEAAKALEDAPGPDMAMVFIGLVGIRDPPRKATTPLPLSLHYVPRQYFSFLFCAHSSLS